MLLGGAALLVLAHQTLWFAGAAYLGRNDLADVAWGLGFLVVVAWCMAARPVDARDLILYALVTVWSLRLSTHIAVRSLDRGEDFRYRRWREEWRGAVLLRSYLQVFLLQGALMLVVAAPVLVTAASEGPPPGRLAAVGAGLWAVGFFFEAVGDRQLLRFIRDPEREGLMTEGLWRYTRHPNYFGEVTLWCGVFLVALPAERGVWAAASPIAVTVLLLFVSGIPMLEEKYEGDPEFEAYRRRTSAFVPLPPRKEE